MDNSSTIPSSHDIVISKTITILNSMELIPLIALFFMTLLNFKIILRSSLLHKNLKVILLTQSTAIAMYAVVRFGRNCWFLATGQPGSATYPITFDLITFGNMIGHILIIERTMATVWAQSYEQRTGNGFSTAWIIIMMLMVVCNHVAPISNNPTNVISTIGAGTFLTHLALLFSAAEIVIFALLILHNIKRYNQNMQLKYNLAERYQLSENMATGKQLGPSFLAHLVNIMCSNCMIVMFSYQLVSRNSVIGQLVPDLVLFIHTMAKLCIEITVITFHPKLNRDFGGIVKCIFGRIFCRLNPSGNRVTDVSMIPARNLAKIQSESEQHFRMLQTYWGQ